MFIYTVKASTLRFCLCLLLAIAVLVGLIALGTSDAVYASVGERSINYGGMKDNDARLEFIESFGLKVASEPQNSESITLPREFNRFLMQYNQVQKKQGLDLEKYKHKRVTYYSYKVENYDYPGDVFVNLVIYRERIIACDISSTADGGFILPLTELDQAKLK